MCGCIGGACCECCEAGRCQSYGTFCGGYEWAGGGAALGGIVGGSGGGGATVGGCTGGAAIGDGTTGPETGTGGGPATSGCAGRCCCWVGGMAQGYGAIFRSSAPGGGLTTGGTIGPDRGSSGLGDGSLGRRMIGFRLSLWHLWHWKCLWATNFCASLPRTPLWPLVSSRSWSLSMGYHFGLTSTPHVRQILPPGCDASGNS